MPRTRLVPLTLVAGLAFIFTPPVGAQVYFGEDFDGTEGTPSALTTSISTEAVFLSFLTGVGTETFEGLTPGTGTPLPLVFPGAGTATLSGGGGYVGYTPAGTTNGVGRYSVPSGTNYFDVDAGSFLITFSSPVAAFGFYGIDIGDFGAALTLSFLGGPLGDIIVPVPHFVASGPLSDPDEGGGGFYFGRIAVTNPFTSVAFSAVGGFSGGDVFAFDNMTIGSVEQVVPGTPVPEPMTVVLLATGLIGIAAIRPRLGKKVESEEE